MRDVNLEDLLRRAHASGMANDYPAAEKLFERATEIDAGCVEAWRGLGLSRRHQGKLDSAISAYQRAASIVPPDAALNVEIGIAWRAVKQEHLAIRHFRAAVRQNQDATDAYLHLGDVFAEREDWRQAGAAYYECLKRKPADVAAALGVAQAFSGLGLQKKAQATLIRAARLNPQAAEIHTALGNTFLSAGSPSKAVVSFERAVALEPHNYVALKRLAAALRDGGRLDEAIELYRKILSTKPDDVEALVNAGIALLRQSRFVDAEETFRTALRAQPFNGIATRCLADALSGQFKHDDAREMYRRADEIEPGPVDSLRQKLSDLLYGPSLTASELRRRTVELVSRHEKRRIRLRPPSEPPKADQPIRIGWVSSDLRYHVVAMNLRPLIANLDREKFRQYFYADTRVDDPVSGFFRSQAAQWRVVEGLSDAETAEIIRRDQIDILVILAARFDKNRPLIATYRPARIQVSYHDPATSGLASMDYLISDRYLTPRAASEGFTERLLRLPSFYVRQPLEDIPPPGPLPMATDETVTLGCFNNPMKIGPETVELWARLLARVPRARIVLRYYDHFSPPEAKAEIRQSFVRYGIDPERIQMSVGIGTTAEHLTAYHSVDLALDTFPFSGSTTTFEALSMGVPVVTRAGPTMCSRWSASMLNTLKLDDFIAGSNDEYIAIVSRWAQRPKDLAALRQALPARLAASPLCNGERRTRQIERLFRAIWCREFMKTDSS